MEMCRFEGRDDDGYKKFLGALKRCLRSVSHENQQVSQQDSARQIERDIAIQLEARRIEEDRRQGL